MSYKDSPYFHVGRASDLTGKDRILYRFFEMVPGILAWGTILLTVILSRFVPTEAAIFIIIFDLYWLLKTVYLSIHLRQNWKRTKHNMSLDWIEMLKPLKHQDLWHMVILPFYDESEEIITKSIAALLKARVNHKQMIIVLGGEERKGIYATEVANSVKAKFEKEFGHFITTIHPKDTPGEMPGKGSNITYAAKEARVKILDVHKIAYEHVMVSALDIDTIVYKDYFACVAWHFYTAEDRYNASYQPVPFFNNNMWDAPALSRVVASSGTFWQMVQQERPEKLATFSSHSIPFKTLHDVGYWQVNMVSEDSRIFWNAFVAHNGNYRVIPLSYPVSMDANLASSFWKTLINIYKQQRRWAWGSENVPYILFNFIKNKEIPLKKRLRASFIQLEGFWSLATNPILIFLLGWLPLILGGKAFNSSVLSYNLPFITRNLMILAMSGLVVSSMIFLSFLPERPERFSKYRKLYMIIQWLLVPFTIVVFGAFPGLDAETRLMIGRHLGFWVTPKHRKSV